MAERERLDQGSHPQGEDRMEEFLRIAKEAAEAESFSLASDTDFGAGNLAESLAARRKLAGHVLGHARDVVSGPARILGDSQDAGFANAAAESDTWQDSDLSADAWLTLESHILTAEAVARADSLDETLDYVRSRCDAIMAGG